MNFERIPPTERPGIMQRDTQAVIADALARLAFRASVQDAGSTYVREAGIIAFPFS